MSTPRDDEHEPAERRGSIADLYAWAAPRDLDTARAEALLASWSDAGADAASSPFEPSTDVAWFFKELTKDLPSIEAWSDAERDTEQRPIWLCTETPAPARLAAIRLSAGTARDDLETILGLAAKYDLMVFDANRGQLYEPLEMMAAHASSTFWPRGAIRALVAGLIGAALAIVSSVLGIFVLSGIGILIGGFLVVMAVITFLEEGRRWWRQRDSRSTG